MIFPKQKALGRYLLKLARHRKRKQLPIWQATEAIDGIAQKLEWSFQ